MSVGIFNDGDSNAAVRAKLNVLLLNAQVNGIIDTTGAGISGDPIQLSIGTSFISYVDPGEGQAVFLRLPPWQANARVELWPIEAGATGQVVVLPHGDDTLFGESDSVDWGTGFAEGSFAAAPVLFCAAGADDWFTSGLLD